jgi:hypothetical protein
LAWQAPSDDFREEGFSNAGVAQQDEIGPLGEELQIQQAEDTRLGLLAGFVMEELESVDTGLRLQARAFVAAVDGALFAGFQFHVGQPF